MDCTVKLVIRIQHSLALQWFGGMPLLSPVSCLSPATDARKTRKNPGLTANRILAHMTKWRVVSKKIPSRQFDDMLKFLPGLDRLTTRSVVVSTKMDPDRFL